MSTDSEAAADPRKEPLEHYPELMRCVTTQGDTPWRTRALVGTRCGCRCGCTKSQHLPGDHAVAPFSAHKLDVIKGVFLVYQNYQSLLDYSERDALTGLFNRKTFDEQFARKRPARPEQQQAPGASR